MNIRLNLHMFSIAITILVFFVIIVSMLVPNVAFATNQPTQPITQPSQADLQTAEKSVASISSSINKLFGSFNQTTPSNSSGQATQSPEQTSLLKTAISLYTQLLSKISQQLQPQTVKAEGTTKTWVGTTGDINASTNWNPSGVPASGDILTFDDTGTTTTITGNPASDVIVIVNTSSKNYTLSGIFSGTTSITKQGTSTLILSGANTFTGGLTIKAGTAKLQTSANAAGTGIITIGDTSGSANATLQNGTYNLTYANPITVASGSSGTLTIQNISSTVYAVYSGLITLNNNLTLDGGVGSGPSLRLTGNITGTGNIIMNNPGGGHIELYGSSVNPIGSITHSGVGSSSTHISAVIGTNVTAITQNSTTSALTLSGINTYAGPITNSAGKINLTQTTTYSTMTLAPDTTTKITAGKTITVSSLVWWTAKTEQVHKIEN